MLKHPRLMIFPNGNGKRLTPYSSLDLMIRRAIIVFVIRQDCGSAQLPKDSNIS